jgi:hypothetical protein
MNTLFLAWRQQGHRWWPVGRLVRNDRGGYEFSYTRGALDAKREANFAPILSFPSFEEIYRSEALFPMFSNRILSENRIEYDGFMKALDLPISGWVDPISVLGRSGGQRMTDTFEVFPLPVQTLNNRYQATFFVHGLEHQSEIAEAITADLRPGDKLELEEENENTADPNALRIVASLKGERLGYVPRYLCRDIHALRRLADTSLRLDVERINLAPTPKQFRILCRLDSPWVNGFAAFSEPEFESIAASAIS